MVGWYPWVVLFVLAAIYAQGQWARYSLNYLYNVPVGDDDAAAFVSISTADKLTYADYGLLTGYGFSGTFCLAGLVSGRLADVASRKYLVFGGAVCWNAALFMMAYSNGFSALLGWRLLLGFGASPRPKLGNPGPPQARCTGRLGAACRCKQRRTVAFVGQAFSGPASYSLIADYFPEERRAQANGLFACGVYVGGGLASLCASMAVAVGWRNTCLLIAALGFLLASAEGAIVREPLRQGKRLDAADEAPRRNTAEAFGAILGNKLVVVVICASSLRFCGGYAIAGYLPTFYGAVFPSYSSQYSFINCYVPRARMYLPAAGCFGALPFMFICCLAPNFYVSIVVGLFGEYLVAECWFGPVIATLQSALDQDCRALAIACFTLCATFWGSLASYLLGAVYDYLLAGGAAPSVSRWLVLWAVVASYVSSGALFLYASTLVVPEHGRASEDKPLLGEYDEGPKVLAFAQSPLRSP
ncbi:major facilitator superfamily domain-containing protein [Pelagophyceae sp. CCMP2097]|nr:major facilitator superfamily domain-containing protein [Pelagophyceae sp. CCMP2097]